jgi:UDP-N-acetylmuramate dehydrogenase
VLFADEGFDGIIIHTSHLKKVRVIGSKIFAECGVSLTKLSHVAQENSLSGFEFAHGIPGNCGGAIFMNAGAFGHEICEVMESCTYFDARNNRIVTLDASQIQFSYRHSDFMEKPHRIILSAAFRFIIAMFAFVTPRFNGVFCYEIAFYRRRLLPFKHHPLGCRTPRLARGI